MPVGKNKPFMECAKIAERPAVEGLEYDVLEFLLSNATYGMLVS